MDSQREETRQPWWTSWDDTFRKIERDICEESSPAEMMDSDSLEPLSIVSPTKLKRRYSFDVEDEDLRYRRKRKIDHVKDEERLFACLFNKHDPYTYTENKKTGKKYKSCSVGHKNMSRLTEHIRRHHIQYSCQRCHENFNSYDEQMKHCMIATACPVLPQPRQREGIECDELKNLRAVSRGRTDFEKWMFMYGKLFPDDELIPSPYWSGGIESELELLKRFLSFQEQTLPFIIESKLETLRKNSVLPSSEALRFCISTCLSECMNQWIDSESVLKDTPDHPNKADDASNTRDLPNDVVGTIDWRDQPKKGFVEVSPRSWDLGDSQFSGFWLLDDNPMFRDNSSEFNIWLNSMNLWDINLPDNDVPANIPGKQRDVLQPARSLVKTTMSKNDRANQELDRRREAHLSSSKITATSDLDLSKLIWLCNLSRHPLFSASMRLIENATVANHHLYLSHCCWWNYCGWNATEKSGVLLDETRTSMQNSQKPRKLLSGLPREATCNWPRAYSTRFLKLNQAHSSEARVSPKKMLSSHQTLVDWLLRCKNMWQNSVFRPDVSPGFESSVMETWHISYVSLLRQGACIKEIVSDSSDALDAGHAHRNVLNQGKSKLSISETLQAFQAAFTPRLKHSPNFFSSQDLICLAWSLEVIELAGDQGQGNTHAAAKSSSTNSGGEKSSRAKRHLEAPDGENKNENHDSNRQLTKRRKKNSSERQLRKLACPFHKREPHVYGAQGTTSQQTYRVCMGSWDFGDLLQHLVRTHSHFCDRCGIEFSKKEDKSVHARQWPGCDPIAIARTPGDPQSIVGVIRKKITKLQSQEVKWNIMYETLFPGEPIPASPYCECAASKISCNIQQSKTPEVSEYQYLIDHVPELASQMISQSIPEIPDRHRTAIRAVIWCALSRAQDLYGTTLSRSDLSLNLQSSSFEPRPQASDDGTADLQTSLQWGPGRVTLNLDAQTPEERQPNNRRATVNSGMVTEPVDRSDAGILHSEMMRNLTIAPFSTSAPQNLQWQDEYSSLVEDASSANSSNSTGSDNSSSDLPSSNTQMTDELRNEINSIDPSSLEISVGAHDYDTSCFHV